MVTNCSRGKKAAAAQGLSGKEEASSCNMMDICRRGKWQQWKGLSSLNISCEQARQAGTCRLGSGRNVVSIASTRVTVQQQVTP